MGLLVLTGLTSKVVGQGPGVVVGHVADTAGHSVAEAEVVVVRESDSLTLAVSATDARGAFRISQLPAGGPYVIFARKIGYQPVDTSVVHLRQGDTLSIALTLRPYAVVLPELTSEAKLPRLIAEHGFLGIRLFHCLFIGLGKIDEKVERDAGCRRNADARAAQQRARAEAQMIQETMRHVEQAIETGHRPEPREAILVLNTVEACGKDIPGRPKLPLPDPDVHCREVQKRIPRETLERLGRELKTFELAETFSHELHRLQEAERRRAVDRRAAQWTRLLEEAEARYTAQTVREAVSRIEQALKTNRRPDSTDVILAYDAVEVCGGTLAPKDVLCHTLLKQTSRKKLEHAVSEIAAQDSLD